uniref:Uncharacterized protein n=1 Tax=Setaria viridis TaxID=4556 RepID=A0A4U6UKM7_SETVI|nr:hypothetical protein SEVIR_5G168400v2 [Setaria viridis]
MSTEDMEPEALSGDEAPDEAIEEDDEGLSAEHEDFDPAEVYMLEDFVAEDARLEEFRRKISDKIKAKVQGESSEPPRRRQSRPRRYISCNREAGHDNLVAN